MKLKYWLKKSINMFINNYSFYWYRGGFFPTKILEAAGKAITIPSLAKILAPCENKRQKNLTKCFFTFTITALETLHPQPSTLKPFPATLNLTLNP